MAPALARSRSIGGRLNSAPGQLHRRQIDESMIELALAIVSVVGIVSSAGWLIKDEPSTHDSEAPR